MASHPTRCFSIVNFLYPALLALQGRQMFGDFLRRSCPGQRGHLVQWQAGVAPDLSGDVGSLRTRPDVLPRGDHPTVDLLEGSGDPDPVLQAVPNRGSAEVDAAPLQPDTAMDSWAQIWLSPVPDGAQAEFALERSKLRLDFGDPETLEHDVPEVPVGSAEPQQICARAGIGLPTGAPAGDADGDRIGARPHPAGTRIPFHVDIVQPGHGRIALPGPPHAL